MRRLSNFMMGFVIGGLIGATVALLMSPSSGEELRLQIVDRAKQIQSEVQQAAAARRAELEQRLADLRAPRPRSE